MLRSRFAQKQWWRERRLRSQVEDKVTFLAVLVRVEHTPALPPHTFHTVGIKTISGLDFTKISLLFQRICVVMNLAVHFVGL